MLTLQEITAAVNGRTVGESPAARPISAVAVDSRQVSPGTLFVAMRGESLDGHDFVSDAFERGATAAVVERVPVVPTSKGLMRSFPMVQVADSAAALQSLARYWRSRLALKVVGVTGSVGKTTTKEVIAKVLEGRFRVIKSEGNMNTEIGMPLTLLRATPEHEVAVLEMGMYDLGEIRTLARLAQPEVGVVTNVGPIHLERLGSLERIAEAKGELVEELPESGVAVLNFDDETVRQMASRTRARVAYFGTDARAGFWADDIQGRGLQGIEFDLRQDGRSVHVRTPLLGVHSVHAALAASVVAHYLGMSLEETAAALHEVSPSLRLIVAAGINGSTLVDDSYNASPAATLAALNLLVELEGRKVAVLGDMLELGSYAGEGHDLVGRRAAIVADVLVVVGSFGELIGRSALDAGKSAKSVFFAATNEKAVELLKEILGPGDCVLVKGSRGMHMEHIVEAIRCPTP